MEPTYAFKNGNVYTISGGKVIASVKEADFNEASIKESFDQPVPCPSCQVPCEPNENGAIPSCPHCGFVDTGGSDYAGHPPEVADRLRNIHQYEIGQKRQASFRGKVSSGDALDDFAYEAAQVAPDAGISVETDPGTSEVIIFSEGDPALLEVAASYGFSPDREGAIHTGVQRPVSWQTGIASDLPNILQTMESEGDRHPDAQYPHEGSVKQAVHQFDDGWSIKQLQTNRDYRDEGNQMGHCIGTQCPDDDEPYAGGAYPDAFSLRDPEGSPQATYQKDVGAVGRKNMALDPELMARLQQWNPEVSDPYGRESSVFGFGKRSEFMEPADNFDSDPEVQLPDPPDDLQEDMLADIVECPACGSPGDSSDSFCSKCGEPLADTGLSEDMGMGEDLGFGEDMLNAQMIAKVTSPNGLEGKVVNRTPSLWGDEVTVRFANGRVKTMPVTADMKFTQEKDDNFGGSNVDSLRERLAASVPGDMASLQQRQAELRSIWKKVANEIGSAPVADREALDTIAREASAESREIGDAIQRLVELEGQGFVPTAPFRASAVESAELGRTDDSWLHEVVANMTAEAHGTDYSKLMNEGPEIFITAADDALVADAAATRQAATRYVRSFTSSTVESTTDQERARYETHFLSRVEECRKKETSSRKQAARKEASSVAESAVNAPDDCLFT